MTLPDVPPISTILVPLDGSSFSASALPTAVGLAERLDADIHLLSAVPTDDDVPRREAELAAVGIPWPAVERSVVVDLDVPAAIHAGLQRFAPAVACMASHGRGRTAALVGSVATEVIIRGHDPLVLVGPMVAEPPRGSGVVACADEHAEESDAIIKLGLIWAGLVLGEPMTAIVVSDPVPPATRGPTRHLFGPDGDVDAYLEALVEPLRADGNKVKSEVVWDPISPADGIVSYVEDHPADLVVVGSHGRKGLRRLVLGSVAASTVHRSPVPVLVNPVAQVPSPSSLTGV